MASFYQTVAISQFCNAGLAMMSGMKTRVGAMASIHKPVKTFGHVWMASVSLLLASAGHAQLSSLEGQALDMVTGQVVYQERHTMAPNVEGVWIMESDYLDADGALFAERSVWFDARHPERPNYRLIDYRDDFEEGATTLANGEIELYRIIDGDRETAVIRPSQKIPLVIDAGFSALIANHWEELLSGRRISFDFASSARLTTIQFRLSHQPTPDQPDIKRFTLEPSNWFIRMLVKPIKLTYGSQNKALIGYEGLSNIRKAGGGNHEVLIAFPPDHQFTMRQLPSY